MEKTMTEENKNKIRKEFLDQVEPVKTKTLFDLIESMEGIIDSLEKLTDLEVVKAMNYAETDLLIAQAKLDLIKNYMDKENIPPF